MKIYIVTFKDGYGGNPECGCPDPYTEIIGAFANKASAQARIDSHPYGRPKDFEIQQVEMV